MKIREYKEYERKAAYMMPSDDEMVATAKRMYAETGVEYSLDVMRQMALAHAAEQIILSERMETLPGDVAHSKRDRFAEERIKLLSELAQVNVHSTGQGPWVLSICECGQEESLICTSDECGAGERICTIRELLHRDLQFMTEDNRVSIMTDADLSNMEWGLYQTVREAVWRSISSPFLVSSPKEAQPQ